MQNEHQLRTLISHPIKAPMACLPLAITEAMDPVWFFVLLAQAVLMDTGYQVFVLRLILSNRVCVYVLKLVVFFVVSTGLCFPAGQAESDAELKTGAE